MPVSRSIRLIALGRTAMLAVGLLANAATFASAAELPRFR